MKSFVEHSIYFCLNFFVYQQTPPFQISPIDLLSVWQQTQLIDSKTMLYALQVNFENFGHITKNKIFRLVIFLADLSTRLKRFHRRIVEVLLEIH